MMQTAAPLFDAAPESSTTTVADARGVRIVSKSIFRELRSAGLDARDVVAVATELLGQAADELRASR